MLSILTLILQGQAYAQTDAHYWSFQYGAKGLLLNGAIIADPGDETSLYYNPGAIGKGDNLGFAISFLTPNYSVLSNTNLLGDQQTFSDSDFGLSPGFFAVRFRPFNISSLTFGVTTFERFKSSVRYEDRSVSLSADPIQDIFRSDIDYRREVSQTWYGLGAAYEFNKSLSIGITQFLVFHDEKFGLDLRRELYGITMPDILTVGARTDINYNISFGGAMISKIGFAYENNDFKLGLTYTSSLYGNLNNSAEYSLDLLSKDERRSTNIISNRPEAKLNDYQTPWSIGFGLQTELEYWDLYFSAEYFSKINEYNIIDDTDDPFDGLIENAEPVTFRTSTRNRSVLNLAIGARRKLENGQSLLFGFRTDFNQSSNFNLNDNISLVSTSPTVVHISGGGLFNIRRNVISAGFDYGFGFRTTGEQLFDNQPITRDNLLDFGTQETARSTYHTLTLFMTYDFIFSNIESMDD